MLGDETVAETLFVLALAPALICLFYIYIRDKYEKEPWRLLIIGVVAGALLTFPIIRASGFMAALMPPTLSQTGEAVFISFAVAGLVEEGFKFAALFFLIWYNRNLNEKMDGIVYAVFISLGFAGVENVLYVFHPQMGGMGTALMRALVSVPAHGFFGVIMGYYFSMAKFEPHRRTIYIFYAFAVPFIIHGIYNTLLLSGQPFLLLAFIPFIAALWLDGFKKIKKHLAASPFKNSTEKTT
jgi:RsiW-degrading membrane proteinase PrsW (M82 family)